MVRFLKEASWSFGVDGTTIPAWFVGLDSYIQLIVATIAFILSIYVFKIYKLSGKKKSYFLGLGFFFISLSYFIWSILNLGVITKISDVLCQTAHTCIIDLLTTAGIYIHMLLLMAGLLNLIYMTLKGESNKLYYLLFGLAFLVIIFSHNVLFFFYLFSILFLIYLVIHQFTTYFNQKRKSALFFGISFLLLSISKLELILGLSDPFDYSLGNIFSLAAYIIILVNLISILRK